MSLFAGMTGVLTDVFGAPVTCTPRGGGAAVTVDAVFRAGPTEVTDSEGHSVLLVAPTLRVRGDLLPDLARGDLIAPSIAGGKVFTVVNKLPGGSPAADAFVIAELEEVRA